ncbi:MAG: 4-(cytidine 5'-diphospho)-2-C-methyl-D-erythritol kinase [Candidatus Omnitrophica bacterium]|nr:4-(cytidine 5'-diphospho)-2-C-methyl-D-erythritol kinase [Candidatus Omnitrophota bacterium]MDD5575081.1 4-(cytidine 5'-diphospho)-2-C-methyl-D-erythritol kinase [Candidatus Omnitrophota bacterium]
MASTHSLSLSSYAKVNLYLDVIGRRPDGYHELLTLFERISLCDTIRLTEISSDEIVIASDTREIPCDATNLAWKAADLIKRSFSVKKGVKIEILKRIPVGGGLGGGSSNAACVLSGMNRLFGLGLGRPVLVDLANRLGSDVAFFVSGRRFAVGRGRGGDLKGASIPSDVRLWHVLFVPPRNIITKDVYALFDRGSQRAKTGQNPKKTLTLTKNSENVNILLSYLRRGELSSLNRKIYNRLSETVEESYSFVSELRADLSKLGLKWVHMSGSGPTLFVICKDQKYAQRVYDEARARLFNKCRVFCTSTL